MKCKKKTRMVKLKAKHLSHTSGAPDWICRRAVHTYTHTHICAHESVWTALLFSFASSYSLYKSFWIFAYNITLRHCFRNNILWRAWKTYCWLSMKELRTIYPGHGSLLCTALTTYTFSWAILPDVYLGADFWSCLFWTAASFLKSVSVFLPTMAPPPVPVQFLLGWNGTLTQSRPIRAYHTYIHTIEIDSNTETEV